MESESKEEDLTFNGFPIKKRGKVNAENLASSILARESTADLISDLKNEGVGLDQMEELQSTLGDERQGGKISDDRKQALDRLEEVRFSIIGSPENLREKGDTFRGESGRASWAAKGKYHRGIRRRGRKKS